MDSNILYSKLIEENLERGFQIRLVVNEFREVTYIQLRKYFLSYEGEWIPSREGISIPLGVENICLLLDGILEVVAKAEGFEIIQKYMDQLDQTKTQT